MPNKRQSFSKLIPQNLIREDGKGWHRTVFGDVKSRLGDDPNFPCLFSKNAFRK
jgi:N-omega-hydroxy-L-arginine synthase